MNPRRAAPQGPEPCAFDLTRPPPRRYYFFKRFLYFLFCTVTCRAMEAVGL